MARLLTGFALSVPLMFIALTSVSFAATLNVLGPQKVNSGFFSTKAISYNFVGNPKAPSYLVITNGNGIDYSLKVCAGSTRERLRCAIENAFLKISALIDRPNFIEITHNGKIIVTSNMLQPAMPGLQVALPLQATNLLVVKVGSLPTQSLTFTVKSDSNSQNQLPLASFMASPVEGVAPEPVIFNAMMSADPDGTISDYFWDFGDASTGVGSLITHNYVLAGTYLAKLTVTDNQGGKSSVTRTISVKQNQLPLASFTAKPDAIFGSMKFQVDATGSTDRDGRIVSYVYNMGDGKELTTAVADYLYGESGTYTIQLTVTDNKGAQATASQVVKVFKPVPPMTVLNLKTASTGIAPHMSLFDAGGTIDPNGQTLTYAWDFGDGETSSESGMVSHIFKQAGNYQVTLLVTNQSGLKSQKSISVTVQALILPAKPEDRAPQLTNQITPPTFSDATSFLYKGDDPIQKGVAEGALQEARLVVMKGRIENEDGSPVSGVKITIAGQPELGSTYTREDGLYDIAANGGGPCGERQRRI